jgi:dTDP-D-glucose 4,6-dehydratase
LLLHGPPRNGDIRASYADISKAKKILGYNPTFTVRDGLREVTKWFAIKNEEPLAAIESEKTLNKLFASSPSTSSFVSAWASLYFVLA